MPIDRENLIQTLQRMKQEYENAIRGGNYTSLIRSKRLINILQEFVINELSNIIDKDWIITDKKVYGFPKKKEQDILIQPPQDNRGNIAVGPILAVNIRSQLSSIEKNYDTLFERIFAEALNLHNRFPYMVLGYLYLLPHYGYALEAAREQKIALTEHYNLEKYILSFLSISGRENPTDVPWKYERVCLLIVDFSQEPPVILDNMEQFVRQGLVSEKFRRMFNFDELSINDFFDELYKIMMSRYYLLIKEK